LLGTRPEDLDGDGVVDFLDNCPLRPNPNQRNYDWIFAGGGGDGDGDACDSDDDDDTIDDPVDNCTLRFNPSQSDSDRDGIGDVCDSDDGQDPPIPLRADAGGPYAVSILDLDRFALVPSRSYALDSFQWDLDNDGMFDVTSNHPLVYGLAGFSPQLPLAARVPGSHELRLRVGDDGRFSQDTTTLTVAIPGDLNADRVVDRADFAVMTTHYGAPASETSATTGMMGDLTEDDRISLADLVRMRDLMGSRLYLVPPDPLPVHVRANQQLVFGDGGEIPFVYQVRSGGAMYITGGTVGQLWAESGGVVHVFGGTIDPSFRAFSESSVHIIGSEFTLGGQPITGLDQIGDSILLAERSPAELAMVLADGSPWRLPLDFSFAADATLRLTLVAPIAQAASVPEPSSFGLALAVCLLALLLVRRRSSRVGGHPHRRSTCTTLGTSRTRAR
jgi:hypothetical protein